MAFKRKTSDIPLETKAYKFRVFPEYQKADFDEEIKTSIFREARLMTELWNQLVEIRNRTLADYAVIYNEEASKIPNDTGDTGESAEAVENERPKIKAKDLRRLSSSFKERTETLWRDYDTSIKEAAKEPELRTKVSWEVREDVFNRFETAHRKALKEGGELKFQSGFIKQFHFPHRFTGGGLDVASLFSPRSKKIFIQPVDEEFYKINSYRNRKNRVTSGRFGAGLSDHLQISFRIVMHRQIPAAAKIKTVNFVGKYKSGKWEYHLVLAVDQPVNMTEIDFQVNPKRPVAALDLGWRKFEDYLRFGVLADSAGNLYEFRLPIEPGKKQSLRNLERLLAKHGKNPKAFPQTWQDIEDWQTKNDLDLERVKERIREFNLPASEKIKPIIDNLVRVRKSGLMRLIFALEELDDSERNDDAEKVLDFLRDWRTVYIEREQNISYTRDRLINSRNYIYQMVSKWLKENYSELSFEGDLKLQEMAVKAAHVSLLEENGAILKNSAKFRGRVALYELLRWIKQKNRKDEEWLQPKKSAYSTLACRICSAVCKKTPNLFIVCENGHQIDQDVQAAINLLGDLTDDFPEKGVPSPIPEPLRNVIVPINF